MAESSTHRIVKGDTEKTRVSSPNRDQRTSQIVRMFEESSGEGQQKVTTNILKATFRGSPNDGLPVDLDSETHFAEQLSTWKHSIIHHDGHPRFEVSGHLGEGSQGIVFRVDDRDCSRELAFKVMSADSKEPEEINRFIREAQITAQLEHPGVVPVHDIGVLKDGRFFYSMKRVQGKQLADYLLERAGRSEHRFELLELFLRICQTIAFAHSRGIIHRDIKPRNVMVGEFGEVLVMDWGLAKVIGTDESTHAPQTKKLLASAYQTINGTAIGTPAYMSPEQASGEVNTLDRRCDIYSLGVILYEMLCSQSPYQRGNVQRVLAQVREGAWLPLDKQPGGENLPRQLVAIVHRAMALGREERYSTVNEIMNDLHAFLSGGAVSAYRETMLERVARYVDRNRKQVRVGTWVAGVALAFGLGIWYFSWNQKQSAIADLRRKASSFELLGNLEEARSHCERILALKDGDKAAIRDLDRLEKDLTRRNNEEVQRKKREDADRLIAEGTAALAKDTEEDVKNASESFMRALGLIPGDADATANYTHAVNRLAQLEQEREKKKNDQNNLSAAQNSLAEARRAENFGRRFVRDRDELLSQIRRLGNDPNATEKLRRLQADLSRTNKDIASHQALRNERLDKASNSAPFDHEVRHAVAEFWVQTLLEAEASGNLPLALVAETRIRNNNDGEFADIIAGAAWLKVASGSDDVALQALSEDDDHNLLPSGDVIKVEPGIETQVKFGRYLASNRAGTSKAIKLARGQHLELDLRAPPRLPDGMVYIPAGSVFDEDGRQLAGVAHFALAEFEITFGEYLEFLNDPQTLKAIDEAAKTGKSIYAPRCANGDDALVCSRRKKDGRYTIEQANQRLPVSGISGTDAAAYAHWRSLRDHLPWRLPSLYEWQLAAQGGDGRPYPWGLDVSMAQALTKSAVRTTGICTTPVGSQPHDRSVQGVFDLFSSVSEIVCETDAVRLWTWSAVGGNFTDRRSDQVSFASRKVLDADECDGALGFRLALSLPESW